jgi:hypothetical protein
MTAPAPCRSVRYERAGRSFYSATAAGGAKMTHRRGAADGGSESRSGAPVGQAFVDAIPPPCSARRMAFGIIHRVADDYPEVGLSSSSVGRR